MQKENNNEAFDIYISLIDKSLFPIFIEHHILNNSFPLECGVINYYRDLDWEDLQYIENKFGKIDDNYIYIYTYTGRIIDNVMLKFDCDEILYRYAKVIYDGMITKNISEIQKRYSNYINWWLNSHLNDPYRFYTNQLSIYENMSHLWKIAMEKSLDKLRNRNHKV